MSQRIEKAGDIAEYAFGVPLFVAVSAVTGVVMAVGFGFVTAYERVARHA